LEGDKLGRSGIIGAFNCSEKKDLTNYKTEEEKFI
jgi:hypothetical protein